MNTFKTRDQTEWRLTIAIGHLAKLRTDAGFDLGQAMKSGGALELALFGDPETFAAVLWVLVGEQAAARGIDREAFYAALDPDSLDGACDAFLDALMSFYHRRRAPAIQAKLPALLKNVDEKHQAASTEAIDSALRRFAGDSPASSESTPAG